VGADACSVARRGRPDGHHRAVRDRPGGIVGLPEFLSEWWEAIEADFQRFYGLDLAQACWGSQAVGVRRLHNLIQRLPDASELGRALAGPAADWDDRTELLAVIGDRLGDALFLLQGLGGVKQPQRFPPLPRPPVETGEPEMVEPPRMSTAAEIREFFHATGTRGVVSDS